MPSLKQSPVGSVEYSCRWIGAVKPMLPSKGYWFLYVPFRILNSKSRSFMVNRKPRESNAMRFSPLTTLSTVISLAARCLLRWLGPFSISSPWSAPAPNPSPNQASQLASMTGKRPGPERAFSKMTKTVPHFEGLQELLFGGFWSCCFSFVSRVPKRRHL